MSDNYILIGAPQQNAGSLTDAGKLLIFEKNSGGTDNWGLIKTLSAPGSIDDAATSQLVNVSTRGYVGPGEEALIPGFVFGGTKSKTFLIRAAGPALASLGIDTPLADPVITLYKGQSPLITNDDWSDQFDSVAIEQAFASTGAFAFEPNSKDAAFLITLAPGLYTAIATSADTSTGIALVEVYELP